MSYTVEQLDKMREDVKTLNENTPLRWGMDERGASAELKTDLFEVAVWALEESIHDKGAAQYTGIWNIRVASWSVYPEENKTGGDTMLVAAQRAIEGALEHLKGLQDQAGELIEELDCK